MESGTNEETMSTLSERMRRDGAVDSGAGEGEGDSDAAVVEAGLHAKRSRTLLQLLVSE